MRLTYCLLILVLLCLSAPSSAARDETSPGTEHSVLLALDQAWVTTVSWLTSVVEELEDRIVLECGDGQGAAADPGDEDHDLPEVGPGIVPIG